MDENGRRANPHWLVLGGARSGKTKRAMAIAEERRWRLYVATAEARDDEMRARIAQHRCERGAGWTTIEAPIALAPTLERLAGDARTAGRAGATAIVVDCLTIWLSNLMLAGIDVGDAIAALIGTLHECRVPVIMVSNEVGSGIVPENQLAREFRDAQGRLNQSIAAVAGSAELVIAGLSMRIK